MVFSFQLADEVLSRDDGLLFLLELVLEFSGLLVELLEPSLVLVHPVVHVRQPLGQLLDAAHGLFKVPRREREGEKESERVGGREGVRERERERVRW